MIFVKNSRGGREVNIINTLSKINLSKIGWEGGRATSIWIMSLNILCFFRGYPKRNFWQDLIGVSKIIFILKDPVPMFVKADAVEMISF